MDKVNRFTEQTWRWLRAEHTALLLVLSGLVVLHAREVYWERFIAAFVAIDLAGYLPGAIAFRRAGGGRIAPLYHHLYNVTHSYLTAAAVVGLWALAAGCVEWAMLAVPIHLSGDRGLLGNVYKPVSMPFEAVAPQVKAKRGPVQAREDNR